MTAAIYFAIVAYLLVQRSPVMYYVYLLFPMYFLTQFIKYYELIGAFLSAHHWTTFALNIIYHLTALECIAVGYFKREMFSSCFIFLGIVPTLFNVIRSFHPRLIWLVTCIFMSFFTLLPPDFGSDTRLVYVQLIFISLAIVSLVVFYSSS